MLPLIPISTAKLLICLEEENTTGVEIFDEFSVGGILYTVTNIKGNKVYLGVSGVVNDSATTVFIPQKIKYKGNEMTAL